MTELYSEWRDFYTKRVSSWMSLEELRAECGRLQTADKTSPELLLIHAMHALEERAQRDEALREEVERLRATLAAQQPASVDEVKEPDLWRCTVCGRFGTVGRCCGEETRERANMEQLLEENEQLRAEVERDKALLRQALEALEELQYAVVSTAKTDDVSLYYRAIVALHERLGRYQPTENEGSEP